MRFAIKTSPQHTNFADMLAVWQAADDIELFESGWTFDHFYPIFSDHTGPCLEGWVTTTALAQATKRLRVGVLVTGNVYRHPAVLANMAASLDVISNGRLEFGIGAGWNQQECDAYGIDLPPLRERFDMFDEAVEVIVRALHGDHGELRRASTTNSTTRTASRSRCNSHTLRSSSAAVARSGRCEPSPDGRSTGTSPAAASTCTSTSATCCAPTATTSDGISLRSRRRPICASTRTTSTRSSPKRTRSPKPDSISGIVYLPQPHTPAVLEPLAKALQPLAG